MTPAVVSAVTAVAVTPMMVTVPPGVAAGTELMVLTPSGQSMRVTVPNGLTEGAQFQVLAAGAAPPPRSQDEGAEMLAKVPGFEVAGLGAGDDAYDWSMLSTAGAVSSTWQNPFGINTAVRGAFPVKTTAADGASLGTFCVASSDRFKGDMGAAFVLPDKTMFAQWGRTARPTMIQAGDTVLPVSLFGAPYGQLETSSWGLNPKFVDGAGGGVRVRSRGCNQPTCYLVCGAFVLFFPTCGIGSCFMFYLLSKTPQLFDLKRSTDEANVGLLKMWANSTGLSSRAHVRVDFEEQTDPKTKLGATLASLFFLADMYTSPPSSNSGGGGGAPEVAVMER